MRIYIIASPHVISEAAAEETVVINLNTGSYYNLNADASRLWSLFVQGVDVDAIKEKMREDDAGKIEVFFDRLLHEGLIKPATGGVDVPAELQVNPDRLGLEVFTDMQDLLGLDPIHEVEPGESWPKQQKA